MKNLLLVLLFIPLVCFGQTASVRDIDLTKTFVVRSTLWNGKGGSMYDKRIEDVWNVALFENGLDVGNFSTEKVAKDTNNREMELKSIINKMLVKRNL